MTSFRCSTPPPRPRWSARGEVTATELVEAAIERIEGLNPELNAVVTPMFDRALDAARTAADGPFAGVPYLLKDLAVRDGRRALHRGLAGSWRGNVSTFDSGARPSGCAGPGW